MGYTTDFCGEFKVTPVLDETTRVYLKKFNETRRMARKVDDKYGVEGEFYVDGGGDFGQADEDNVIDHNRCPSTQPGLWCQWTPNEEGTAIQWDGGEKFNEYIPWLAYIIKNFLEPKGYYLNGTVTWQGEDSSDIGSIEVIENVVMYNEADTTDVCYYGSKDQLQKLCKERPELREKLAESMVLATMDQGDA